MEPNSILLSALINVILDAVKNLPFVKTQYIPLLALVLGGIIYPIESGTYSVPQVFNGILIGAGAVGLYEASASIAKSKKMSDDAIAAATPPAK